MIKIRDNWLIRLSPATVARRFAIISNLYTVAIKDWQWTYIKANPTQLIRKPIGSNERARRLHQKIYVIGSNQIESPHQEIDWIVRETSSKSLPTIITLALETAMRRSEIINITRSNIDFERGTVFLPDTKNGTPRLVPLTPIARYSLIMYISRYNFGDRIFNITASAVTSSFLRACRSARATYELLCKEKNQTPRPDLFIDLRFHDLRHEATSRLAEIYEMHELAKITGHKDTRMLLRYYHPDASRLSDKFAQSRYGQEQFNLINRMLLNAI